MIVYNCVKRFFCTPLKRYVPVGAQVSRWENIAKLTITNFPDSNQDPFNTLVADYEIDNVEDVT